MIIEDKGNYTRIEVGADELLYSAEIGGPVVFNGHKIPSDSIWEMLVSAAIIKEPFDIEHLFKRARRAEIYRLVPMQKLVLTSRPLDMDEPVAGFDQVYLRTEPSRIRPLFDHWNILVGVMDEPTPENLDTLFVAMQQLGYLPIDEINDRYYGIQADKALEFILATTGGLAAKPQQLAKFLKRPGSTSYPLVFNSTGVYTENDNDGTIAITSSIARPVQGTFIGGSPADIIMAKGVVRPPLNFRAHRKILRESEVHCDRAAFGKHMPASGSIYALNMHGKESCSLNYQTVVFSFQDPGKLIDADTEQLSIDAFSYMSEKAKTKTQAGVPGALLVDQISPWNLLTSFQVSGVRGMVYGSHLVPPGRFALLPASFKELQKLTGQDPTNKTFLVHRDPALPDSTTTYAAKCYGKAWFDQTGPGTQLGVVINPYDEQWKRAGGDFDGDSAAILVGDSALLIPPVDRCSLRVQGTKYEGMPPMERMKAALNEKTDKLLGPLVLSAVKLAERGLLGNIRRAEIASAIQAAVEAKKHPVDHEAVQEIAKSVFAEVRQQVNESGVDFYSAFQNRLKAAPGNSEKVAAWDAMIETCKLIVGTNVIHPSTAEYAMAKRALKIDSLYRDIGFLRAQVRAEMPAALRKAARAKCSTEAAEFITKLALEYKTAASVIYAYSESLLTEDSEGLIRELKTELSGLRQKFRYYTKLGTDTLTASDIQFAAIAYAPPRLAATFVDAEIFQELAHEAKEAIVNLYGHTWENSVTTLGKLDPIPDHVGTVRALGDSETEVRITILSRAKSSTRVYAQTLVAS